MLRDMDISVMEPCSFATVQFPQPDSGADSVLENMVSLIKIAHHDPKLMYATDSVQNLTRIQEISTMEMTLSQDILYNMENFRAVIQLIVSTGTRKVVAGETLMRWKYQGKDVSPATFIPVLEMNRMICEAGHWILEEALKACFSDCAFHSQFLPICQCEPAAAIR